MKKKKIDKFNLLTYILILIGSLIASYPFISQYYYRYEASREISLFDEKQESYSERDMEKIRKLDEGYNASLHIFGDKDIDKSLKIEGKKQYRKYLEEKEGMGYVTIPRIGQELPIYMGTTEEVLQKGVGILENSSLPIGGEYTHSVLTAHRGLPQARLFTDLNKMELDDIFYVRNKYEILAYQVDKIEVIEPTDYEKISIVNKGDYVTLLTCTPYMINSHRLIVRGKRIPYSPVENTDLIINKIDGLKKLVIIIYLLNISLIFFKIYKRRNKRINHVKEKQEVK